MKLSYGTGWSDLAKCWDCSSAESLAAMHLAWPDPENLNPDHLGPNPKTYPLEPRTIVLGLQAGCPPPHHSTLETANANCQWQPFFSWEVGSRTHGETLEDCTPPAGAKNSSS